MINNVKNKKKKRGFTLIELIIVIAIIAILAALAIPKFSSVRQSANLKSDIANAKTIANATLALLTDGTISANSTAIDLSDTAENSNAVKIKAYLQSIPEPKAATGKFIVDTSNGDVIVYVASSNAADSITAAKQVYPEPLTKTNNIWYGGKAGE